MATNYLTTVFFGVKSQADFVGGIQHAINRLNLQEGIYTGDNLFTDNCNLSLLAGPSCFVIKLPVGQGMNASRLGVLEREQTKGHRRAKSHH